MGNDLKDGREGAKRHLKKKGRSWSKGPNVCCVQGIRRAVRWNGLVGGLGTRRGGKRDREGPFRLL